MQALVRFKQLSSPIKALICIAIAAFVFVLWSLIASLLFLAGTGMLAHRASLPLTDWWMYWWFYGFGHKPVVGIWLKISGGFTTVLLVAFVIASLVRARSILPTRRSFFSSFAPVPKPLRSAGDNYGHADFLSIAEMQALFPPTPDDEIGGIVVGEADRVDLGPAAHIPFNPENRATWGNGGKAPLMIDHCKTGSSHSFVIGGSGSFKSVALVTSLLTWRGSFFCLDPAEELAALVGAELEDKGRKVVHLEIGGQGPNVLAGIDISSDLAETRLRSIVGRITGPVPNDGKGAEFKLWGRQIILALLAHMMWEPTIPAELKTLRALRAGLDGGMEATRNRLRGIAEHSHSSLARSLASNMFDMVNETYSGAIGNATRDTEWLASSAYADLVSGDAYDMSELVQGNLCVFCQVPQEALEHTPSVARVLVGCHLDAVFAAKGNVKGRVFFPIDEAVLIGRDPALKIARDQGRKSKITLQLAYQSDGQIDEIWTPAGKRAWFDGLSWRTYAGVQNLESAREISAILGTYGARAVSTGSNRGKSGKGFEVASASKGTSSNENEISRELMKTHELLAGLRSDERITLVRNCAPLRHGAAIAFRRPELAHLLGETSYRRRQGPALAAE